MNDDYDPRDQAERIKNYWTFGMPVTDRQLKCFASGTQMIVLVGIILGCTVLALKSFGLM